MRRVAYIVLVTLTLWSGIRGSVVAQTPGLTMAITVGFDGYCRGNAWCPLRVVLTNEGADITGELRIAVTSGSGGEPDLYSRTVTLPTHSRKAYFVYIPGTEASLRSRLTVRLMAGDEELASQEVVVVWVDAGDRVYGVVSRDPSALNFLSDTAPAGKRAVVAHLDLEALPPEPLGWEALDVLVLNDVDTSVLDDARRQALGAWTAHGGQLFVGGGAGALQTMYGVADWLPVTVTGLRQVDDLRALGDVISATVAAGPFVVAESSLLGGEVLVEQAGLILLARRSYGAGYVNFLAFDAGLNPFARWDDNTRLWRRIAEVRSAGGPWRTVSNGYEALGAVNAIPGLKELSALEIVAFMLVYTLLIGPVNYLVLRKLKRRELAWLTIPLIITVFTVFAYVTGFSVRGSAAIVHRLGVVYVPPGTHIGRVSEVVGLFSPRRTRYDARVTDAGVCRIPGSEYFGSVTVQPLRVVEDGSGMTVTGLRVDVGGVRPFLVEGYADVPPIATDLWLKDDQAGGLRLIGALQNSRIPLRDTVLIVGDSEQRLGNLDTGEQARVDLALQGPTGSASTPVPTLPAPLFPTPLPFYPSYGVRDLPERILGPGDYWQSRELYRRYQLLRAYFPYDPSGGLPPGVYLMGWREENAPLPIEVVGRPYSTVALALYVYRLPVAVDIGESGTIPSALITRQVESSRGSVNVDTGDTFYMGPQSEVVFRFTVWPEVAVGRVDELVMDLQRVRYGTERRSPTVSLWNQASGRWENVDIDWGRHTISNAAAYVSPSGDVRVRLKTDAVVSEVVGNLTITIRGQP